MKGYKFYYSYGPIGHHVIDFYVLAGCKRNAYQLAEAALKETFSGYSPHNLQLEVNEVDYIPAGAEVVF